MTYQPAARRDLNHLMENRGKLSDLAFVELLNEIVKLEGCGWEMGPDPNDSETTVLAISAFGNQFNINRIAEELGLPLYGDSWLVIVGIPPRIWERYFKYEDSSGKEYEIEGLTWRYRLDEEHGQNQIVLDSYPNDYPNICDDLAHILCVGELGERNIIDFVSKISCAKLDVGEGKLLGCLRKEFSNRFVDCHYKSVLDEASEIDTTILK